MQTKANGQAAHGKALGAVFTGEAHGDRDSRSVCLLRLLEELHEKAHVKSLGQYRAHGRRLQQLS